VLAEVISNLVLDLHMEILDVFVRVREKEREREEERG